MGRSTSISTNISETSYTNAPIAQENVSNPINLTNSAGTRLNSSDLSVSGNYTALDGGAINAAFGFGSEAIKALATLTKENVQSINKSNADALGFAGKNNAYLDKYANKDANSDWMQNKTFLYILGAVGVFYVFKAVK